MGRVVSKQFGLSTKAGYLIYILSWAHLCVKSKGDGGNTQFNERWLTVAFGIRHLPSNQEPQLLCCSVVQSRLTLLRFHGLQHSRLPYLSLSSGVCWNSCPLSRWCHPTISPSVAHFSCPQSFPVSGSFPMSGLFTSGGQSIGASASASVLPVISWVNYWNGESQFPHL